MQKMAKIENKRFLMATQLNHHHHTSTLSHRLNPPPQQPRPASLKLNAVLGGRAQELLRSGAVTPIPPKDAALAMGSQGYKLLDIRPQWEWDKARVPGSLHVPLFVEDRDNSPITLVKKWVHFGYIGLWTGQYFTMINPGFVEQVGRMAPDKETKLLVACGEGLRSLMAVGKLHDEGGYRKLGWLAGGFSQASDEDFPGAEGSEKLQYATVGGASYYFLKLLIALQVVGKKKS